MFNSPRLIVNLSFMALSLVSLWQKGDISRYMSVSQLPRSQMYWNFQLRILICLVLAFSNNGFVTSLLFSVINCCHLHFLHQRRHGLPLWLNHDANLNFIRFIIKAFFCQNVAVVYNLYVGAATVLDYVNHSSITLHPKKLTQVHENGGC